MMLADVTPTWAATVAVISFFGTGGIGTLSLYFMWRQTKAFEQNNRLIRQQQTNPAPITPQPLEVEVVEQFHERFASKLEFTEHVKNNSERHALLFSKIETAEATARTELATAMKEVTGSMVFIRENLSAINRELQIRHE